MAETERPRRVRWQLAVLAAISGAAAGQTAPADAPAGTAPAGTAPAAETRLERVDVTGKSDADARITSTAARIVVGHDEIVRFGDTSLVDVLKRLPGITVTGGAGNTEVRMRGLGTGYTQVLLDGEPAPAGFSLETLSPDLIERIEIQRAPTADTSMRAIAGTINIVLRKSARKAQHSVKVSADVQDGEPGFTADLQLADAAGTLAYSAGASLSHVLRRFTSEAEQVSTDAAGNGLSTWVTRAGNRPRSDALTLTPRISWTRDESDTLSGELFVRASRATDSYVERTTTLAGAPPPFASDVLGFTIDSTNARARLDWKHRFAGGSSVEAKAGLNYFHRASSAHFLAFDANDVFVLDRVVTSAATEQGAVASGKFVTPLVQGHAIALGWDGTYTDRTEFRVQNDTSPVGLPPLDIDERYDARVLRLAFFAQDEWDITGRWSAYVGVRWEGLDTRTTGNVIDPVHNRSGVVSPALQTLWKLPGTEHDQLRASLARTYKPPTTFELTPRRYIANNNTVATPDYEGNPHLRPELAWGIDAAYEHHDGADALVSVSVYARRIDDVILNELYNRNGTWFQSPTNSGRADVRGIELDGKANLQRWWAAGPDVKLHGNVARNHSRVEAVPGPDNRLARQTPLTANVGADWTLARVPVTAGANYTFTSGGPVRLSFNRASYDSAVRVLDAYALWKVDPRTQLRFSVSDVLAQDRINGLRYMDELGATVLTTTNPAHVTLRIALELTL